MIIIDRSELFRNNSLILRNYLEITFLYNNKEVVNICKILSDKNKKRLSSSSNRS